MDLDEDEIRSLQKQIEFNKTESETLRNLVEDARRLGDEAREQNEELRDAAQNIRDKLDEESYLRTSAWIEDTNADDHVVGIDGSFQTVGGQGGIWYVPYSIARVEFDSGPGSEPKSEGDRPIGIETVEESDTTAVQAKAARKMMVGETKAIRNWGAKGIDSILFIDGPIMDPPSYSGSDYVADRCDAVRVCFGHCRPVGCVKRSRDRFFIEHLRDEDLLTDIESKRFPSDQHLMLHVFSKCRERGDEGPLFSKPIEIDTDDSTVQSYRDEDVYISIMFFQAGLGKQVLRLDIPTASPPEQVDDFDEKVRRTVKNVDSWIYPGQEVPLPVELADQKCRIRKGCAEVLYDEIMSRSRTSNKYSQIITETIR